MDGNDEDINPDTGIATSVAPSRALPGDDVLAGPITRACAHELNFVMMLKNEGPEGV